MESVHELLVRYCELVDTADWDAVGELFRHGALVDGRGNELASGAESVAAFYRSSVRLHDGTPGTKHLVLNIVIRPDGDHAVTARSSYLVLQALDGFPLQPIITGRYHDHLVRRDGSWTFAERRFFVDLAGDLSRHLTYEV
jgi:3-phenylpropionate/cinnamic acid dioxygenase small subunit